MRVAVLFIDGVGAGARNPDFNPLAQAPFLVSAFEDGTGTTLPHTGLRHLVDATFGLGGRPQSASNQAALYTGVDAPPLVGEHVAGYPNAALRALIREHSLVTKLREAGREALMANAYPAPFLELLGLAHDADPGPQLDFPARLRRRARASASTLAMAAASVRFRTFEDAREGRALTHDIDGRAGRSRGFDVPLRTPAEAAKVFWRNAVDFTLFEHFLADEAGHLRSLEAALEALQTFDSFAHEIVATRPEDAAVIICSDHGNVEDLRTRNHTTNAVPVLTFGAPVRVPMKTVADVGRLVLDLALANQHEG